MSRNAAPGAQKYDLAPMAKTFTILSASASAPNGLVDVWHNAASDHRTSNSTTISRRGDLREKTNIRDGGSGLRAGLSSTAGAGCRERHHRHIDADEVIGALDF